MQKGEIEVRIRRCSLLRIKLCHSSSSSWSIRTAADCCCSWNVDSESSQL